LIVSFFFKSKWFDIDIFRNVSGFLKCLEKIIDVELLLVMVNDSELWKNFNFSQK